MIAAELMVKALENEGVKYIFGVPGEENEAFLFALESSSIVFVPTRHEQGAAFMADVWGRLTGSAGVCLATLGPGATNLITAIADANLDKAPLVAITGQGSVRRLHHESHQVIDVVRMMNPITKWSGTIRLSETITEMVRKAFKIAEAEKPGATHLELPEDVADEDVDASVPMITPRRVRRPVPSKEVLDKAVQILLKAKKPLIIAGNGGIRTRASSALTKFATDYNIPVTCTFMGKGAVSDKEDVSLGAIGLGFKDYVMEAIKESDLVICVGYDVAEVDPKSWNTDRDKSIIHIDFDPAEVFLHYAAALEVVGDLAAAIDQLHVRMKNHSYEIWYSEVRKKIARSIESYTLQDLSENFHAPGVIAAVRSVLPDDGLVISDVGSHKMWIARNFRTYVPNGCLISNGLATMGIALPGGIGAKMAMPGKAVVCIMGDGGAMMNIQELETAKRLGISCTFIILNDNNYGLIEWKQEMNEGKSFGTRLTNPDFVALAESFGIAAYKPKNVRHLKDIVTNSIENELLTVIEIPISTEVNKELINELQAYFA